MGRQSRTSAANSPNIASKPFRERIHELLVFSGRSRWWGSDRRDLLPRRLLVNELAHLVAILRLLIAVICTVRLPAQIGVCRIDGGFDVIAGDGSIHEFSKRGGGNRPDGA